MPSRVYKNGTGLVINLPKVWTRALGIAAGTVVATTYTERELVISLADREDIRKVETRMNPPQPPNLMVEAAKKMVRAARV